MKRLYADFNDFAADGTLPLTSKGSVDSIDVLADELWSGEEVVLSDGEMQVFAQVFRRADGSWEARSNWSFVDVISD